jgi:acetyl-CoA carboxylase biotin carboxyl carrier protein
VFILLRRLAGRKMAHLNLKEIRELIDLVTERGFAEFEFERQGFRLRIKRFQGPAGQETESGQSTISASTAAVSSQDAPAAPTQARPGEIATEAAQAPRTEPPAIDGTIRIIKSPIVGTFYRSASPTAEPFVSVGSHVEPDSVVCIIEAMKLMNEIQAEVSGEVLTIYVENAQPVEYGQPLFEVRT